MLNTDSTVVRGQISFQAQDRFDLLADGEELPATLSGNFRRTLKQQHTQLLVGDWVNGTLQAGNVRITAMQPRTSLLERSTSSRFRQSGNQAIAANLTTVVIVTSANHDFNLERLRRYHAIATVSRAKPAFLITKTDLITATDLAKLVGQLTATFPGTPVFTLGADQEPAAQLAALLRPDACLALIGSSGVGKSTLVGKLTGEDLYTKTIRQDDAHGRHATTNRRLFVLPSGTRLIDTPGMRAVGVAEASAGFAAQFSPIEELAASCQFRNCRHVSEPGCAVKAAVQAGTLPEATYQAYLKYQAKEAR
ncbi:ribosome small subunit-dependent GTPase A [Lacticaseibacillus jixianensis]|uniref:Small ribosomal subunit biogenesis GTPase RsgA n=1 Tax=Lacticaseibacillus jixianensis TaxID=2486012 RepID=A0ABW4BA27_9LACO|nr:ribosome small subunit-dependent GTPase A [Lacticaseibacillus jixianensis]